MLGAGEFFVSASKLSYHFEYSPIKVEGWWSKLDDEDVVTEGRDRTLNEPIHGVRIVDVACGAQHTIALAEDGNIFTWGFGGYGRLGHTKNVIYPKPATAPPSVSFSAFLPPFVANALTACTF
jgi:hypothetical protein